MRTTQVSHSAPGGAKVSATIRIHTRSLARQVAVKIFVNDPFARKAWIFKQLADTRFFLPHLAKPPLNANRSVLPPMSADCASRSARKKPALTGHRALV